MKYLLIRLPTLLLASIVGLFAASTAFGTATIVIQNNDAAGVGFNDTTPAAPVGGNSGTTVGEQRLIAFTAAANIWGATLTSGPIITIRASWVALACTSSSGTLGSTGATSLHANFANAPFTGFWYSSALANALAGSDLASDTAEINARFNVNVGTPGCFQTRHWYYGLDNNHGTDFDLVTVLLHEFAHGLGFASFTDEETGEQAGQTPPGLPSIFDKFLLDNTTGKTWPNMTNAERQASAINDTNLVWNGPQVTTDAVLLTPGKDPQGHPWMYAPSTVDVGSSVSHWDDNAAPNQLMEPTLTLNLTHNVTTPSDLTFSLLRDIGWCSGCPQPPPPSPTPTPSPPPNDNFANAQVISGCSGSVNGSNVLSTHEAGEPTHVPGAGNRSVWYRWTAPSTGSVTITTAGSGYDTVLAVYTGSSVGSLGAPIASNDDIPDVPGQPHNVTSSVTFGATGGTIYQIAVDGFDNSGSGGDTGNITLNWSESGCTAPNTVRFSTANYPVGEGEGAVVVSVVRTDSTGATTVDLRTTDTDTFTVGCADKVNNNGSAYGRCDFATTVTTVTIPAGQLSTNVLVPIIDDSWAEGNETFSVVLSNPAGATLGSPATATVTINDNETVDGTNPVLLTNDAGIAFFVRQHYLDFLGREPELGEPWSNVLRNCGNQFNTDPASPSAGCDRITVSGAFFGSPEFKSKGIYVIDFYRVAFNRLPTYLEFSVDLASITGATGAETNAKRAAFANNFVLRTEFVNGPPNAYGGMSNSTYVTTLMGRYGLSSITTPDPANPDGAAKVTLTTGDLTNRLNGVGGTLTRAQVLRAIVQSDEVTLNFEAVNAFVASQYYGYLRRTPDTGGFNNWVTYLGAHPTDFRTMVNGFVNSTEYRLRFGPP